MAYDDKVRIYGLVDPARLQQQSSAITQAIQSALGGDTNTTVALSDASGWVSYEAPGELWTRPHPILVSRDQALKIAETYLDAVATLCSDANDRWPKALKGIALIPRQSFCRRISLSAVLRPDGSTFDHWLYRAQPQLVVDAKQNVAPVSGAHIEVRVGHLGKVIHFRARWQPLSGDKIPADRLAFRAPKTPSGETAPQAPLLMYQLDGDGSQQYYLAPYYFQASDHVLVMSSASPWSLTVDIGRTNQGSKSMTLLAAVAGGSGDYDFNWAAYSAAGYQRNFKLLGSGTTRRVQSESSGQLAASEIELANGAYVVLLNVKDRSTGAFRHHQQLIMSTACMSPSSGPAIA
jgi:hypothetical protein